MSMFLQVIGAIVCLLISVFLLMLAWQIAGNIYGGIKGAYRLREIMHREGSPRLKHLNTIRFGLKAWGGQRYRNGLGTYWQMGGMKVPVDGRDPIERERIPG